MFVERGHLRKNTFFEISSKSHESLYPPEAQDLKGGILLKIAKRGMTKRQVPRPIGSKTSKNLDENDDTRKCQEVSKKIETTTFRKNYRSNVPMLTRAANFAPEPAPA